jgi:hypothetical protein
MYNERYLGWLGQIVKDKDVYADEGGDFYYLIRYRVLSLSYKDFQSVNKRNSVPVNVALKDNNVKRFYFPHPTDIPMSSDKIDFGDLKFKDSKEEVYVNKNNPSVEIVVKSEKTYGDFIHRNIEVLKSGSQYFICTDTINVNEKIFGRFIKSLNTTYMVDNETKKVIFSEKIIKSKPITKVGRDYIKDDKISVFDIECYIDENRLYKPFACG